MNSTRSSCFTDRGHGSTTKCSEAISGTAEEEPNNSSSECSGISDLRDFSNESYEVSDCNWYGDKDDGYKNSDIGNDSNSSIAKSDI